MSIKKATTRLKHNKILLSFTQIFNEVCQGIRHTGAAGIYMYLASKPEDWEICKTELARHFNCGIKHINTCFKHLKDLGLIQISPHKDEKGKILYWETILHDRIHSGLTSVNNDDDNVDNSTMPVLDNVENPQCGKGAITKERDRQKKDFLKNKDSNTNIVYFLYELFLDEIGDKTFYRGHAKKIIDIHMKHKDMTFEESLTNSINNLKKHMQFTKVEKPAALFIDIIKKDKYFGDTKFYTSSKKQR